jgi:hypothetical protein
MFNFHKKKKTIQLPAVEKLSKNYDLIIHIGAPKAGSSAIQKYLLENRSKLLEVGFYYPEHGLDENGISCGHSILGKNLKDGYDATAMAVMQTYLMEAKQRNCALLISTESLYDKAEPLKKILKNHRCKIIAFFRDPLESLYSNYNQGIKRNYLTTRLETFCQSQLNHPDDLLSGHVFDQWANIFGKEHITILGYDTEMFSQTPIQSIFLSLIGIDAASQKQQFIFDTAYVNNSYCLAALELKRMLNFVLDRKQTKLNDEIDWFLQGISDKSNKTKYQLADRISTETYSQLRNKFATSTPKIREKHLLTLNPNFLNDKKPSELKTVNQHQLSLEMVDLITQFKQKKSHLYRYIQQQLEQSLHENNQHYEIIKLAEMFNYDLNKIQNRDAWFNPNQLNNMLNMKLVDFYRDIAYLCYYRGDFKNAYLLIEKAREIRPNGPTIIKLSEQLKKALNIK